MDSSEYGGTASCMNSFVLSEIKSARIRWLGHVEKMAGERVAKQLLSDQPVRRRRRGRPRKKWLNDVEDDLVHLRVREGGARPRGLT